jgi:hypothetical protein
MGWRVLHTLILVPVMLAIAALVLLAIGLHAAHHKLLRRQTCTVN